MKSLLLDSKTLKYKQYRDSRYDTVEDFEGGFSGEGSKAHICLH